MGMSFLKDAALRVSAFLRSILRAGEERYLRNSFTHTRLRRDSRLRSANIFFLKTFTVLNCC